MIRPYQKIVLLLLLLYIPCGIHAQNYRANLQKLLEPGETALNNGKIDTAIADFQEVVKQYSWWAPACFYMGMAYSRKGNKQETLNWWDAAIKIDPKYTLAYITRANYELDSVFNLDLALSDVKKAIKYGSLPDLPYYYMDQGRIYLARKDSAKAIESLNYTIEKKPFLATPYGIRGVCKLEKDESGAIQDFTQALQLDHNCISANYGLGVTALKHKEPYNAISYFTAVLNVVSYSPDARYQRAIAYDMQSDYKDALEDFLILTKEVPDDPEGWLALGHYYYMLGDYQSSIDAYTRAIDLDPNNGEGYTQIIIPLSRTGKFDLAKRYFDNYKQRKLTTEIEKNHWTFYDIYARVITEDLLNGYLSVALTHITAAISAYNTEVTDKSEYTFGEGMALKGYILDRLGRKAEAVAEYHQALQQPEIQPDVVKALERLDRSNKLANNPPDNSSGGEEIIAASENPPKYYAILIAENNYQDKNFKSLEHPEEELSAFQAVLVAHYHFSPSNIIFIHEADRDEILSKIESVCSKLGKEDNLIIYYAGHGYAPPNKSGGATETFWVPAKAKSKVTTSYIGYSEVLERIELGSARHVLMIEDACSSGALSRGIGPTAPPGVKAAYDRISRTLITSGRDDVPDESQLAKYLRTALENNKRPFVCIKTLFEEFNDDMLNALDYKAYPDLIPMPRSSDAGGDFVFMRD